MTGADFPWYYWFTAQGFGWGWLFTIPPVILVAAAVNWFRHRKRR